MDIVKIRTSRIEANKGQIEGLPKNPRQWTKGDVERIARSLEETPELFEARPVLVYPHGDKFVALGGNLRLEGAKKNGLMEVPCIIFDEGTDVEKLKEIVIKDNGSFGSWDFDDLANEWDDLPLVEWGAPAWETRGLSTAGAAGDDDYDEFVDKFKPKLTTDDCYTPPAVYDAVLNFVASIVDLKGKTIERPFVPGGDYEHYPYTERSVVVDNPPFSLLSKICRVYADRSIPFFIFAPSLTLFSAADCDLTYIVADAAIEYENGAVVATGFITNLIADLRVWCCPALRDAIAAAQPDEDKTLQGFVYPDNIITAAILQKITKRSVDWKVRKKSCEYIKQSDSAQEQGRQLYGGGFILSERAAAERAAAERAAAERAAATKLNISPREREIIARLDAQDID